MPSLALREIAAAAATIAGVIAYAIYVRSAIWGGKAPRRVTWVILAADYLIITRGQSAAGADAWAQWLPEVILACVLVTLVVSIRYGAGGAEPLEISLMAFVGATIATFWMTHAARAAIILALVIEIAGLLPTIAGVYRKPGSESLSSWGIFVLVGVIDLWAAAGPRILLAYPAELILTSSAVVAASGLGSRRAWALRGRHARRKVVA